MQKTFVLITILITFGLAFLYTWFGINWDRGLEWWMIVSYIVVIGVAALIAQGAIKMSFPKKVPEQKN